jgi:mono/diheme cytochrome c family protein
VPVDAIRSIDQSVDAPMRFLLVLALATMTCEASSGQEMSYGQAEYLNSCAVCHGIDGKGDGPLRDLLVKRPADLTHLSERNGGTFPYSRVFATIDGRYATPSHGNREMPVWGRRFLEDDAKTYGPSGGEVVTTERIHNLAGYIETLQH